MLNETDAQIKWDRIYQNRTEAGNPCRVLANHLHLLPKQGRCLDLACGLGANSLLLAAQGLETHAWDISSVALEQLNQHAQQQNLSITTHQRDIETQPPTPLSFDVIVVSQFLYRPLFADLMAALKPCGLLFYQTYHQQKLSDHGPSNPKFLLAPNELLSLLAGLQLVYYREDSQIGNLSQGLRDCCYYIGQKI